MSLLAWFGEFSAECWPLVANHLWQATLFAGAAILLAALLRRSSAQTRYLILLVALINFALPPALFVAALERLPGYRAEFADWMPSQVTNTALSAFRIVLPIAAGAASPTGAVSRSAHSEFYGFLAAVWLLGCAAVMIRWVKRHGVLQRTVGLAAPVSHGPLWDSLDRGRRRLSIRRNVALALSDLIEQPGLWGVWRPMVILPAGIEARLSAAELETLLAHELIHVKRWDNLTGYVQLLLCAVFWFHPLLWWLDRRLLAEREAACDEAVVHLAGRPDEYAATLLKVCRHALTSSLAGVSRITESNLEPRMERIMSISHKQTRAIWRRCLVATTVAAAVIFSVAAGLLGDRPLKAQQSVPPEHWLETPVAYIISDAELAAFERLTTQAEREHFIEQFWKMRDPTPATPENETKTEFDRRVQFSTRWATAAAPGWKTDRGRIYIVYGPPDEIESHPEQSTERWLYHSGVMQNVILEFSAAAVNSHPARLPKVLKKYGSK